MSWFDHYWVMNWKRSLLYLAAIGGFVYHMVIDWFELNGVSKVILMIIGVGFTFGAFYLDWRRTRIEE